MGLYWICFENNCSTTMSSLMNHHPKIKSLKVRNNFVEIHSKSISVNTLIKTTLKNFKNFPFNNHIETNFQTYFFGLNTWSFLFEGVYQVLSVWFSLRKLSSLFFLTVFPSFSRKIIFFTYFFTELLKTDVGWFV